MRPNCLRLSAGRLGHSSRLAQLLFLQRGKPIENLLQRRLAESVFPDRQGIPLALSKVVVYIIQRRTCRSTSRLRGGGRGLKLKPRALELNKPLTGTFGSTANYEVVGEQVAPIHFYF